MPATQDDLNARLAMVDHLIDALKDYMDDLDSGVSAAIARGDKAAAVYLHQRFVDANTLLGQLVQLRFETSLPALNQALQNFKAASDSLQKVQAAIDQTVHDVKTVAAVLGELTQLTTLIAAL